MKDVSPTQKKRFKFKKWWLYALLFLAICIYYYIALPAIHYASIEFWIFLLIITAAIVFIELITDSISLFQKTNTQSKWRISLREIPNKYKLLILPWPILFVIAMVGNLVFSPLFMAEQYSNMIQVTEANFGEDFPETNVNQIPLVDRDTAERLGNRQLGNLTDLVSQFVPADDYTQININSHPYRVTPLEYAGFFRWLNNVSVGIPHYVQVDNVSGEVKLQTPESPIRYSFSELFNRNVMRKLRFSYPFALFDSPSFEVDDQGTPYYIASTYGRNFFLREPEVTGVITLNAMTGETQRYALDEIPEWIDRVYSAELVLHQITTRGHYKNGFFNYLFAQNGVTEPTQGYNYLPINDDLYLYTGITSVVADESNIGFILVNLRTKEATFYPLSVAEEFSAMSSAEGSVQETSYKATFPLLINIEGRPLYILTLKDQSGLIKEYALIDAQNYQQVYVESNVTKLLQAYALDHPSTIEELDLEENLEEIQGTVENIQAVVVEGDTVYYFTLEGKVYKANIALNDLLPFLEPGIEVNVLSSEDGTVQSIEWEN